MISQRSKSPPTPAQMPPPQRLDMLRADDPDRVRPLPRAQHPYERYVLDPAAPIHYWGVLRPPASTRKFASLTAPLRVPIAPLSTLAPRPLSLSPRRPHIDLGGPRSHKAGSPIAIQRDGDRALSPHRRPGHTESPPRKPRAFFDVVLSASPPAPAAPPHAPAPDNTSTDSLAPSKSPALVPAAGTNKLKPKRPTPQDSDDHSYDPSDDQSSDEHDPAPSRHQVLVMLNTSARYEPPIPTSNVRGTTPDTSCQETRRLFEIEYSTHKKRPLNRRPPRRSPPRAPKPKLEAVRKSTRLATRSATPADADSSATDISLIASSRSVSVASARNPTRKPKSSPSPRSKAAPSNSTLDRSTPQPTSIAYPLDDPPPPAPTNVVSLRPGYNAYTAEDKQWFLDFVAWVFRQNVHAGKAEICQDIFQQAPHHRLESWKSYWRDHISQVEMLRNIARDQLDKAEQPPRAKPQRSRDKYSSGSSSRSSPLSTDSNEVIRPPKKMTQPPNKSSEGLWKLAELAELESSAGHAAPNDRPDRSGSMKRRMLDADYEVARTKRARC